MADRVSLRLIALIAVADFAFSISSPIVNYIPASGLRPKKIYEILYVVVAFAIALILPTIAIGMKRFKWQPDRDLCCWAGETPGDARASSWGFFYSWVFTSVVACTAFIGIFAIVLRRHEKTIETTIRASKGKVGHKSRWRESIQKRTETRKLGDENSNKNQWVLLCSDNLANIQCRLGYGRSNGEGSFLYFTVQTRIQAAETPFSRHIRLVL
ncbi:uncharacterized protein EV422DRAFT_510492 [Fimicolochytrium jonesii]|uniref:uncharacterized protein n=1 Tax=Fimicolochytrium jonesii TaxID=1396493 RepID=UPI0022FED0E6|nr:uncharacterized protein EV422DRAFT_510492 [Fimicolochytrium jonesii]KAI8815533.1 hypothetical protein EV422DRAFT_510492 [Fimicolochytrium jonesii]